MGILAIGFIFPERLRSQRVEGFGGSWGAAARERETRRGLEGIMEHGGERSNIATPERGALMGWKD